MKNETVSHFNFPILDPAAENGGAAGSVRPADAARNGGAGHGVAPVLESRGTLSELIAWGVALACSFVAAALAWSLWLEASRPIQVVIPAEDAGHVLIIPITPAAQAFDGSDQEIERWQKLTR